MVDVNLENIVEHYTLSELEKLRSLLRKIEEKKKAKLEGSTSIYKYSKEYQNYIKITFSNKYLESVGLSFKHLIEFFGEEKLITQISKRDFEEFKAYIMNRAPKGFPVYLRTLKAAFNIAVDWGNISTNPFQKVKFKKSQTAKPVFIDHNELQAVLSKTDSETMKNIFTFAFNTGCRLGEIVNLKWSNINLNERIITIGDDHFITKSNKQRVIPISEELQGLLNKYGTESIHKHSYVFSKESDFPFNGNYVSRYFKKSCRKAGLSEAIHFHTLRHSFASHLAIKGVPLITIKELLGHSSIVTTEIYSHTNLKSLQEAIEHLQVA